MQVVTYETNSKEYNEGLLKYTCKANKVPLKVLGVGDEWFGVRQKSFGYIDFLKELPSDEIVVCCDNRDVIIPSTADEIINKFKKMDGDCYFSPEIGSFPIWEMEMHFPYPVSNNYRPEVRVLNSGVSVGYAGALKEVFEYSTRFYDKSFNLSEYLNENYDITEKIYRNADSNYPHQLGLGLLYCDQLMVQLTCLETDLISLDYDYELIFTSFIVATDFMPSEKYMNEHLPNYPYGTLYDIDFNWGESYRSVYNTYNNTFPLIYHSPGPNFTISQLRKVVCG
tara:strand:- start:2478 stop:3323 length:846 start_codon:yes stop_codon:yes gene_type:complete